MYKIYFDENGWVLERYPFINSNGVNFTINKKNFIEVDKSKFHETFITPMHFAWRVRDGQLVNERFEETPKEEILHSLRAQRESECFSIINRGAFWHAALTEEQTAELKEWYQDWLNVTESKVIPNKPEWLN